MTNTAVHLIQEIKSITDTNQFDRDIEMINGYAGICPISVQPELYTLILKSLRLKEMTRGLVDVFNIRSPKVGYQIETNPLLLSVYLPNSAMKITLRSVDDFDIN